jgi:hypothetical protein
VKAPACVKKTWGEAFEAFGVWKMLGDSLSKSPPKSYCTETGVWWWCHEWVALRADCAPRAPLRDRNPIHENMRALFKTRSIELGFGEGVGTQGRRVDGKKGTWFLDARLVLGIEQAIPGVTWWAARPVTLKDAEMCPFDVAIHARDREGLLCAAVAPRLSTTHPDVVQKLTQLLTREPR